MDKISAYAAYGIKKKANQKVTKNRVKRRQMTRPNNRKFNQKKNQLIKKFANNLKSAGGKISGSNNLKGFEIIPKQINGAAAINKQIKKSAGGKISGSNNLKGFKNIPKQINGAAAIKKQIKNPKIKSMAHDSSDEEHSLNEGSDLSFCSSGDEEFDEYTLNESSFSSQESSPVAVAAAAAVIPRASTNAKRTNGDLNNNNKNKNSNKNAKSSAAQQQKEKAGPPKKTQRKSTAAPSCPLPRQPGKAGAIKSGPLPSKTAAQRRKSLPLPNKMAANVKAMTVVKQEPNVEMEQVDTVIDSVEQGKTVLSWLINPMTPDKFFTDYWETKACQVKRKRANYYSDLVSFKMIDEMLIENHLEFTTNIDLTTYKNGVRETLNVTGRAIPPNVWGHYAEGCSVRILNPSTYLPGLRNVCTALQEHFHCLVGANIYLTPPNSQGFAPHYDDIEAFVLQVEGRKRWRLYAAPSPNEELARTSSGNLKQQQLSKPIYDEVLEPGDLLYFPRGTVHQAVTEQKQHSLHITLSVYQQQAYANLMETLMPIVIQNAIKENLNLRRGLPLSTWNHLGYVNSDKKTPERNEMIMATKKLVSKYLVPTVSQIDNAIDQLAMRYQHEALPPNITPSEKKRTIFGSRTKVDKQGNSLCDYEMTGKTKIRLLRKNVLRLVNQEAGLRLYFYVDNALEYCKFEANFIEIEQAEANAIKMLVNSYPKYITIDNLPLPDVDQCIEIVTGLWERGLLITEEPFNKH